MSRHVLGVTLAEKVSHLRGQEPIVLCLNEKALSVSIAIASQLRAWVYPLVTEAVVIPGDPRIIGVINQTGELCINPGLSEFEVEELNMEYQGVIQDASREAFSKVNLQSRDYGQLNKDALRGRTIIICSDVVRDQLAIGAAHELLKSIATQEIISLVGNIDTQASDTLFLQSDDSRFMDVMTNMFDDDHYFEQPDQYTLEEKRQLAMNISQYWV